MSRDDIVTAPTGGKKPATQQDLEPDIEFLPKFGAFLALTDLDNEWTDHCKDTMNPPSLAELTAADPFYPMYHAIKNHKNAVAFGSPQAFLWLGIFKPIRKPRRVPQRAKKT